MNLNLPIDGAKYKHVILKIKTADNITPHVKILYKFVLLQLSITLHLIFI